MTLPEENLDWFRQHLKHKLSGRRFPFSGSFELTWRCNFQCIHCYLKESRSEQSELPTAAILRLLDQLADSGCIGIALTGGEPLIRDDFREILAHAVGEGFLVSVFTNASLIDAKLARFMAGHPPRSIEVSLYGGSAQAYRAVTGSSAHFERTIAGINQLVTRGLQVRLKAVLLRPLVKEVERMRALARSLGLALRFDPHIDPTLAGNRDPLKLRATPAQAVAVELADPEQAERLARANRQWLEQRAVASQTPCGAGHSSFNLDPLGRLMPCMLARQPLIDASVQGFAPAWKELGESQRVAFAADSTCASCELQHFCSHCPGLEQLDEHPLGNQVYFDCELARLRSEVLQENLERNHGRAGSDDGPHTQR